MRQLLKAAFDPKIKFDLPGNVIHRLLETKPRGTEHTSLAMQKQKNYFTL